MYQSFVAKAFAVLALVSVHSIACASEPLVSVPVDAVTLNPIAVAKPKGDRDRHLVAVLADNTGTETTDFIVPYGVLSESGVANVKAVSTQEGPVKMMPALQLHLDQTIEEFDRQHPAGADIVIVPAMHRADDPVVIQWLRRQSEAGTMVVGVCDGVLLVARAGLLDDRRATGHWYSMSGLRREYPEVRWVADRRYVADGQVITTTGVTASIPVALALVEALGGETIAQDTAQALGVASYGPEHDSSAFGMSTGTVLTALGNAAKFWGHEAIALPVEDGVDEIALALAADAWSRTWRSRALAVNSEQARVTSKRGLVIEVDSRESITDHRIAFGPTFPARILDRTLADISDRYGERTAAFVAMQLEYDW